MSPTKILIVEDESMIAIHLKYILHRAGYAVCGLASRSEEAVEMARREKPEVILMDIRIPGLVDGLGAALEIRTFLDAAIIFITGYTDPEIKQRAHAMNPAGYLVKPIILEDIRAILDDLPGRER